MFYFVFYKEKINSILVFCKSSKKNDVFKWNCNLVLIF
jgi:hypothetical protein